ncbi:N-acetyltransferase [Microbacterium paludicola]|uniref:N-acetyltransferase n=1 Tax=Microbacterium paludicola TaxID=300019 RepID=A0A4Y9FX66_9MICO|nr:GNAT family N-acetyltransferase [Microbacterium paludicola]MBF0816199.1 GNAT family N-acetyltransferase [Microbacterium paludicola]TFU33137.1 N-acetyltransferase [Microbacterium paludicola]
MGEPVVLRTARLTLSRPVDADVDAIFDACQDPLIQQYTTVPSPYARDDAEKFVALAAHWWDVGSELVWAIRDASGLAGMIGLHRIKDGAAELGYWLAPQGRGRGYMGEAARTVVDFAFGPLRLERLEWHAVVGNTASARVAQDLGFRLEGIRRRGLAGHGPRVDGWIAGLLSTDPRTRQAWPI